MDIIVMSIDLCLKHSHVNKIAAIAMTDSKAESNVVGRNILTATSSNNRPTMMLTTIHNCFFTRFPHQSSKNQVMAA